MQTLIRIFLMLLCGQLTATTYYCDPETGNNADNGLSTADAWASLPGTVGHTGSGWVVLQHGDTVYVKGGTTNNVRVIFLAANYNSNDALDSIQIRSGHLNSWGSGRAIFDGQLTRFFGLAVGRRGLTVEGFEVRNIAAGAGGAEVWGNGSACIEAGHTSVRVSNVRIKNNYLHHAYRGATSDWGHGIECTYDAALDFGFVSSIIEFNHIEDIGTKGIELFGTNSIVRNNFLQRWWDHGIVISGHRNDCYNNVVVAKAVSGTITGESSPLRNPGYSIKVGSSSTDYHYNDIWNNLVFMNTTPGDGSAGICNSRGNTNRFLMNTIAYFTNTTDHSTEFDPVGLSISIEDNSRTGSEVRNNLIAYCHDTGSSRPQLWVESSEVNTLVYYNNFFSPLTTEVIAYGESPGPTMYTVTDFDAASLSNGNDGQNNVSVAPAFIGGTFPSGLDASFLPNTSYFALSAATPASVRITGNALTSLPANGAQASSKFGFDILGLPRVNWSMGAYEFGTGVVTPPPRGLAVRRVGGR